MIIYQVIDGTSNDVFYMNSFFKSCFFQGRFEKPGNGSDKINGYFCYWIREIHFYNRFVLLSLKQKFVYEPIGNHAMAICHKNF